MPQIQSAAPRLHINSTNRKCGEKQRREFVSWCSIIGSPLFFGLPVGLFFCLCLCLRTSSCFSRRWSGAHAPKIGSSTFWSAVSLTWASTVRTNSCGTVRTLTPIQVDVQPPQRVHLHWGALQQLRHEKFGVGCHLQKNLHLL